MASSGGSIQLRLSVAGSDEVKAALAQLGPAGADALKQIEQAAAGPSAGLRALDAAGKDVAGEMEGLSGRVGILGSSLSAIGPAGLGAAAAIGAVIAAGTEFVNITTKAVDFAASIARLSQTTGLSTTFLQQFNYAAQASNVDVGTADASIKSLNDALGAVNANLPRSKMLMQDFSALGFTKAQLANYHDASELFPVLADRISALGDAAEREAIAKKLGIEDLLPLLAKGSAGFQDVTDKLNAMNGVMDPATVQAAADAKDKMDELNALMQAKTNITFAQFAGTLVAIQQGFLNATAAGLNFLAVMTHTETVDQRMQRYQGQLANDLKPESILGWQIPDWLGGGRTGSDEQIADDTKNLQDAINEKNKQDQAAWAAADAPPRPPAPQLVPDKTKKPRRPHGPTAEDIDRDDENLDAQGDSDVQKATKDELSALLGLTTDVQKRAAIEAQLADIADQEAKDARQKRLDDAKDALSHKKISQATYDQFVAEEAHAQALEDQAAADKKELAARQLAQALADQAEKLQAQQLQNQIDEAQAQLALTNSMAKRRDLSLQIFDIEEQKKELALQEVINSQTASDAEKQTAQAQLQGLQATLAQRRQATSQANPQSPWDAELLNMKNDLVPINQEFSQIASGGLASFNQGLFDAQGRMNNLGQVALKVFQQMLTALEQYLLKQAEIGLFGGGAQGGGGGLLSLLGIGGGGSLATGPAVSSAFSDAIVFADGGPIKGPGGPRSDAILAAVSNGEFIVNAGAAARWGPVLEMINNNRVPAIPRFAGGGRVGSVGDGLAAFQTGTPVHIHGDLDMSIHAPGADSAQLNRVAQNQEKLLKQEPSRVVSYVMGMKKAGTI